MQQNAIITGANQGLGLAIAKAFVQNNINVLICAREEEKLNSAVKELKSLNKNVTVLAKTADVSDKNSVKKLCNYAIDNFKQVHILVNNAGVYGPMGNTENVNWAEWTKCVEINFYGSVLMAIELLAHFKKNKFGKIIQLAGGTAVMPNLTAYAASKAAIVRFIELLAVDGAPYNIYANSIAPGLLDTRMLDQVLAAGANAAGQDFYDRMHKTKTLKTGADLKYAQKLCLFLASEASNGISGKVISALWDKYEDWPKHLEKLKNSDVYTYKRITGRERNFDWGDK